MSAALALRAAVFRRLSDDADLAGLIGPGRIFDEVPETMRAPFFVLGEIETRPAGAVAEDGEEHRFTLRFWSRAEGLAETLKAASAILANMDTGALAPDGIRLANLVWLGTDARRTPDGRHRQAVLRFRALTEPV